MIKPISTIKLLRSDIFNPEQETIFLPGVAYRLKNPAYFGVSLSKFTEKRTLNLAQLLKGSILPAHLFKLLGNVDIVGDQGGPKTLGDSFVLVSGSLIADCLLPLENIILDYLDLLHTLLLVKPLEELAELVEFVDNLFRL
jgi:hypothetical protein